MPAVMNANEINPIMDKDTLVMPDSEFDGEFTDDWDFSDPQVMTDLFDSLFDVNTLKNAEEFLGIDLESLDKFIEEHDTPVDVVNCIEELIQKLELKEIMEDVESELEMVPVEPEPVQRRLSLEFNPLPDTCIDQCIDDIGDPFAEEEDQLVMSLPVPVERGDSMSSLTSQRPDSPVFDLEDKEPTTDSVTTAGDCWGCQNDIQNQMGHSCCGYASAEDAEDSAAEEDAETVIVSDSDSDTDVEDAEDMLEDLRQQLREATVQIRKLQEANDYKEDQLRRLAGNKRERSETESPEVTTPPATPPPATPPPVERSDTPPPAPKRRRVVARPTGRLGCAFCDWEFTGKHIKDAKFALRTHLTGLNCAVHPEHMHKTACTHTCAWADEGDLGHAFLLKVGFKNTQNIIHEHRKFKCTHCNLRFYNKRTCKAHIERQHYKNI